MGHFAKVVNGVVVNVIKAEPEFFETFIDQTGPGEWIQTSFNTHGGVHYEAPTEKKPEMYKTPSKDQSKALRKNYAGIGHTYDKERDAFIPPKVYSKWVLNEDTCRWEPPIPMPEKETQHTRYKWNDETGEWDKLEDYSY